ncbi:metallophosphoesterase [Candidatus Uhrbacteria bacterium]|nr:metallophosphoesterase [Candidatus Uhrbacteria bacterium]
MEGVPTMPGVWWMFELVIYASLIGGGALMAELGLAMRLHKKTGLRAVAFGLVFIAWIVVFYGSFIEPKMLFVDEYDIDLDVTGVDGELTIAVVSDIHLGPYKGERWAEKVTARLNEIDAEMILMPGDFIFSKTEDIEMLKSHGDIDLPVYSVLGNHDQEFGDLDIIVEKLNGWGLNVLRNRSVEVATNDGNNVDIAGIDDIWYTPSLASAFEGVDDDTFTILIAHNPDVILEDETTDADLVISGHTHGGQIRLPWIGPVPPLPTKLGQKYDVGLFDFGDANKLFITRGVGETGPRARLFNPPTIDVLHIKY